MDPFIKTVDTVLSLLTVFGDIAVISALFVYAAYYNISAAKRFFSSILSWFSRFSILLALIVSLTAMLGSLFYSDIAGYEPCKLCWFQRIVMYPQVLLFTVAFLRKDRNVAFYSIGLSLIGILIASYHYYIQRGGTTIFPCSTVGMTESCSTYFAMNYGYITIPMMALTAFSLIFLLMLNSIIIKPSSEPRIQKKK